MEEIELRTSYATNSVSSTQSIMKIFNNNLKNNSKTIALTRKQGDTGKIKYLPSFSKEWKNIIYCYNKNNLKNIPVNNVNINKIIKSYFNLYFKYPKYIEGMSFAAAGAAASIDKAKARRRLIKKQRGKRFILLKKSHNFLRRIYVSNAEIKHTNNKATITLYTVNRESLILKKKYLKINKKVSKNILKRFILLYKKTLAAVVASAGTEERSTKIIQNFSNRAEGTSYAAKIYLNSKINYLNKSYKYRGNFVRAHKYLEERCVASLEAAPSQATPKSLASGIYSRASEARGAAFAAQNIYLKKIWSVIITRYWNSHLKLLRKYDLMYSLNKYKFNKQRFLPILSSILNKIIRKKIEYNIINLKSIAYNTDLFTHVLALKLKRKKIGNMYNTLLSILNRAYLPLVESSSMEQSQLQSQSGLTKLASVASLAQKNMNFFLSGPYIYKDLKLISILNNLPKVPFDKLLGDCSNTKQIHNNLYNSIGYKNMRGIRLEVKGRLTKRYRADRSIYSLKLKGGLKNADSSFKGLSSVLFRGNSNSNVSYSVHNSKRRIGAFAVKGWISGG